MKNLRIDAATQLQHIDKEQATKNLNLQRERDSEVVRGRFRFFEVPGGVVEFVHKAYKGQPVKKYKMYDGEVYTVPLGVARYLNKNCWYPEYGYLPSEEGTRAGFGGGMGMRVSKKVARMGFESLEFTDIEGLDTPSQIVQVESI